MSMVIMGDTFTFPEGQAATNRVATYAKGLMEHGINVHVIVMMGVYKEVHTGVFDGISYYHSFEYKERSNSFFRRRWRIFKKYIKTWRLLRRLNKQEKIVAINCWSTLLGTHIFLWLMARLLGTKLVRECSEHPLREHQGGKMNRKIGLMKSYIESRFCDGILCISRYIIDLYKERGIKPEKLFHLPSTVDPSRFIKTGEKPVNFRYIGYFGSLTFYRDSVDVLIKAFARISALHPDIHLVLGGFFSSDEQRKKTLNLIEQLKIQPKVKILDYLTRQEVLKNIIHADVLVMARSKDLESLASYPSKLTEYLSTGIPVVSVKVGEIPEFLIDNVNAYLVEPGDDEGMAGKLDFILNNYALACEVGQKGKDLTSTVFNYNYQAKRLIGFINSLYKVQPQWRPLNSP